MANKSLVTLTDDERAHLVGLTKRGKGSARRFTRAHLLRQAAAELAAAAIAQALHSSTATVARIRKRFVEAGLEAALSERPRPGGWGTLDSRQEAVLIALACSTPAEGRAWWTLPWLAEKRVAVQGGEAISDETVRRTLKKPRSSRGRRRPGGVPGCA